MGVTVQTIGPPADDKTFGEWVKAATVDAAEAALREEVAQGFDNEPVVVTDGVPRRDYADVRPYGRIEFIARPQMAEAVAWALSELQRKSPVLTGRYASSHVVMINGAEVAGNIMVALRAVKETDRVQIVNPEPYAKKIEGMAASRKRGVAGARGLSSQAPGGVYRVVVRELVQRYGRSMFFDFKYVKLNTGLKYVRHGKGRRSKVGRDYVYPALQFFIKPTGLPN
jgi:hypothetical protein